MIDPMRHFEIFSPDSFGNRRIDVIGAGATGSRIALSLAKLGVQNIHAWDFDTVAGHNIANQLYRIKDVGRPKVEALRDLIMEQTGDEITIHNERYDPEEQARERMGVVVFVLTDSMASRKAIFDSLRTKMYVRLLIETRMGADNGRIYTLSPYRPDIANRYAESLYSDEDAHTEASLCGTAITVAPTADMISGYAVWQFIRWWRSLNTEEEPPEFEILFGMRSPQTFAFA